MTVRRASSSPTRHCPASRGAVSAAVNAVSADRSLGRRPLGEPGRTPGRYGGVGDLLPQASADNCHGVALARHLQTRRQAAPAQGCPIYPLVKILSGFLYGTLVSTAVRHRTPDPASGT